MMGNCHRRMTILSSLSTRSTVTIQLAFEAAAARSAQKDAQAWPPLSGVLEEWHRATTGAKHVHADRDNVTIRPRRDNGFSYTLTRMKKARPDLFERVTKKEPSANATWIKGISTLYSTS